MRSRNRTAHLHKYNVFTAAFFCLVSIAPRLAHADPWAEHVQRLPAQERAIEILEGEIKELIEQQLPAVVASNLAEFADVFCDEGYYTNDETELICKAAEKAGLKIRLHCDELADTSGAELAVKLGSYSADHLLKINQKGIEALASSERIIATLLPITAMCIREPYAPARKMISAGCAVAIATDCNPGSSMSENMQLAVSLAVIGMGMSPEEALTAATLNGAVSLGLGTTHGTVEIGKYADFVLYDIPSLAFLPYHIGVSDVVAVVKHGSIVSGTL